MANLVGLCGSMVSTSVFGWRAFPHLHLIDGWHVTILSVTCLLWANHPGKLSLPSLWSW